jgi:predicted dehydrogenase
MSDTSISRRALMAGSAVAASRVLGANDRIRLGMIGTGGRATDHIRDLARLRDLNISIAATCDVWRPNREKGVALVEKSFGEKPRSTTDYRELLSWKDVDAVVIATPDFGHPIILQAALAAGKDAYVEKPFATTFADGKAAYLAARASRQVVAVGTQRRSDGHFISASQQVRSGALGKLTRIEFAMAVHAPRWKRPPETIDPADVDWKMFQLGRIERGFDPRLLREWQLFAGETTNGIPGLWMSHYIDLVPWFTGDPYPAGAVSNGGVYLWKDGRRTSDVFYTLLDYPGEFMVMFTMSLTNAGGIRNVWYGTRGTLDCERWILSGEGSSAKDKIAAEAKIEPVAASSHMHNFLECLRSRKQPRADAQAGFSHAVAGIMAATALAEGRRVRFDASKLEIV